MSASNWTTCPRCVRDRRHDLDTLAQKVGQAYGKVPPKEYEQLRHDLQTAAAKPLEQEFREDYEIGVDDNHFDVDYHGQCQVCGLKVSFKHEQAIDLSSPRWDTPVRNNRSPR